MTTLDINKQQQQQLDNAVTTFVTTLTNKDDNNYNTITTFDIRHSTLSDSLKFQHKDNNNNNYELTL